MNIVILDALPLDADGAINWKPLQDLGRVTIHERTRPDEAGARIAEADIVYTNKVALSAPHFAAAPRLKLVSVLATGYDIVDTAAAKERGIVVSNVRGYSAPSAAQTTIALLLELCHHAGQHAEATRGGEWTRRGIWCWWQESPVELAGKTLCVVGLGAIGGRVAQIAEALGMHVIAAQLPGRENNEQGPYPRLPLNEALQAADVVTLHCPMTPETRHLLNAERLALLKPSAFVLNTARGGLADEAAVADALHAGRLAGYAADVLSTEPPAEDNPLLSAPRCLVTPHYAWASKESRLRLFEESVENLRAFLAGKPRNVVNK